MRKEGEGLGQEEGGVGKGAASGTSHLWHRWRHCRCSYHGEEQQEDELPVIRVSPVPADSRERVPTPRVSTTRIGMQVHRLDY